MGDSPIISWHRKAEEDLKLSKIKKPVLLVAARNHVKPIVAFKPPDVIFPHTIRKMYVSLGDGNELLVMSLETFASLGKDFWIDAYK
jgi:hypothetical protein